MRLGNNSEDRRTRVGEALAGFGMHLFERASEVATLIRDRGSEMDGQKQFSILIGFRSLGLWLTQTVPGLATCCCAS